MREAEQLIAVYHMGFLVCLCLTVAFSLLSTVLFFRFRIRRVFGYITGRAEKRSVKLLKDKSAMSVRLKDEKVPVRMIPNEGAQQRAVEDRSPVTELLSPEDHSPVTELLSPEQPGDARDVAGIDAHQRTGRFIIVKEQIWVHTDERI